jgi:hypothetical protein
VKSQLVSRPGRSRAAGVVILLALVCSAFTAWHQTLPGSVLADGGGPLDCSTNVTKGGTAGASVDPHDSSGGPFEFTFDAPQGRQVDGVCIKTGGGGGGEQYFPPKGHSSLITGNRVEGNGCYIVTFLDIDSVRINRNARSDSGASCKQIGHLDFAFDSPSIHPQHRRRYQRLRPRSRLRQQQRPRPHPRNRPPAICYSMAPRW